MPNWSIAHILSRRLEFRDGSDKWKPGIRIQLRLQRWNVVQKPLGCLKNVWFTHFFIFQDCFYCIFWPDKFIFQFYEPTKHRKLRQCLSNWNFKEKQNTLTCCGSSAFKDFSNIIYTESKMLLLYEIITKSVCSNKRIL